MGSKMTEAEMAATVERAIETVTAAETELAATTEVVQSMVGFLHMRCELDELNEYDWWSKALAIAGDGPQQPVKLYDGDGVDTHLGTGPNFPKDHAEVRELPEEELQVFMEMCTVEPPHFMKCLACYAYGVYQGMTDEEMQVRS